MTADIGPLLNEWPYDPGENIRRVAGIDGKQKIQVRLPLGVEQYEVEGRPDGERPHGLESYLDFYTGERETWVGEHGSDEGFLIDADACSELQEEGVLYYYRYLLCFQIGEYDLVIRDTERNMRLFEFIAHYAGKSEEAESLTQYWPYIIRIHAVARAMQRLAADDSESAVAILEEAMKRIVSMAPVETGVFEHERTRSVEAVQGLIDQIREQRPPSEKDLLKERLEQAVAEENYERAARLRDIIRRLETQ